MKKRITMKAPKKVAKRKRNVINTYKGLPVLDAPEDLTITANKEDWKKGIPGDLGHCIYACGIMRETGSPEVEVGKSRTLVMSKDRSHWTRYQTSKAMRAQFVAGDLTDNKFFKMFDFTIKKFKAPSKRLGRGTQGTKRIADSDGKKTRPSEKAAAHKPTRHSRMKFKDNGIRERVGRLETITLG